jgi:hypothetical protein
MAEAQKKREVTRNKIHQNSVKEWLRKNEKEALKYADSIRHTRLTADTTTVITSQ